MKVRIVQKSGYANPKRGLDLQFSETADLSEDLAAKLVRLGIAELAPPEKKVAPKVETAEAAPPANAALRVSKPKSRTVKP